MEIQNNKRYESLDILRGLCAFSILVYHYTGWVFGRYDASHVIGRFGVYGVSMFYVLSGLTMYLVYFRKFSFDLPFVKEFFTKRLFRIYPLMLFVVLVSFLFFGTENDWKEQLLVSTGTFSVLKWDASSPTGMWSIGNELSFYLMLPFIFLALKKGKVWAWLISLLIFGLYLYFGLHVLNSPLESVSETRDYKNPLNQAGLFLGGILIGHLFKEMVIDKKYIWSLLIFSAALFCFYPTKGELRNVYIGMDRIIFTLICFAFTLAFFKVDISFLPTWSRSPFVWMGEISYSLYLLHPLIFNIFTTTSLKIRYILPIAVILSFLISWAVFKIIENPLRNLGYRLLTKKEK